MCDEQTHDEQLRQLIHNIRHCLHVIGMGTSLLKELRHDDVQFAELCASIDTERKKVKELIEELVGICTERPARP